MRSRIRAIAWLVTILLFLGAVGLWFSAERLVSRLRDYYGVNIDWSQLTLSMHSGHWGLGGLKINWQLNEKITLSVDRIQFEVDREQISIANADIDIHLLGDPTKSSISAQDLFHRLKQLPVRNLSVQLKNINFKLHDAEKELLGFRLVKTDLNRTLELFRINFELDRIQLNPLNQSTNTTKGFIVRGSAHAFKEVEVFRMAFDKFSVFDADTQVQFSGAGNLVFGDQRTKMTGEGKVEDAGLRNLTSTIETLVQKPLPIPALAGRSERLSIKFESVYSNPGLFSHKLSLFGKVYGLKPLTLKTEKGLDSQFEFVVHQKPKFKHASLTLRKMAFDLPCINFSLGGRGPVNNRSPPARFLV